MHDQFIFNRLHCKKNQLNFLFEQFFFLLQFYALLEMNPVAMSALQYRPLTIFAPTNQAFQRFIGNASVLYHICKYYTYIIYTFYCSMVVKCLRSLLLTFIIKINFCTQCIICVTSLLCSDDFFFGLRHTLMHVLIIL